MTGWEVWAGCGSIAKRACGSPCRSGSESDSDAGCAAMLLVQGNLVGKLRRGQKLPLIMDGTHDDEEDQRADDCLAIGGEPSQRRESQRRDRKSTRLNSSH